MIIEKVMIHFGVHLNLKTRRGGGVDSIRGAF